MKSPPSLDMFDSPQHLLNLNHPQILSLLNMTHSIELSIDQLLYEAEH